jgi:hypothetical protein
VSPAFAGAAQEAQTAAERANTNLRTKAESFQRSFGFLPGATDAARATISATGGTLQRAAGKAGAVFPLARHIPWCCLATGQAV